MNRKEIFEAMEAKEKKYKTGSSWTFSDVRLSTGESGMWFLRIGRIEGIGETPLEAMLSLHKNVNDPNYEPIPF